MCCFHLQDPCIWRQHVPTDVSDGCVSSICSVTLNGGSTFLRCRRFGWVMCCLHLQDPCIWRQHVPPILTDVSDGCVISICSVSLNGGSMFLRCRGMCCLQHQGHCICKKNVPLLLTFRKNVLIPCRWGQNGSLILTDVSEECPASVLRV
jgi:hypothetical protein